MATMQAHLDRTLLALADPTRRALLQRLSQGETRVTDLALPFAMSLNGVSKHIRILERASLVTRRQTGREHYLAFNRRPLDEVAEWIATQRAVWTERLDALEALLEAEDASAEIRRKRRPKTAVTSQRTQATLKPKGKGAKS